MAEDLSKRKKVGDVYRSGSFAKAKKKGLKVSDLKKSQLKRAQTVGGKKITARQVKRATNVANKTNISDTSFVKGQGVMKDGKLLTGSVTLASGKTAQYVKGRRVVAGPKKDSSKGGSGSGSKVTPTKSGFKFTGKGATSGPLSANTKVPMRTPPKNFASPPAGKSVGTTITNGGKTFRWNGKRWTETSFQPAKPNNDKSLRPGAKPKPKVGTTMKNGGKTFRWDGKSWKEI
jgi:hypothetical protein